MKIILLLTLCSCISTGWFNREPVYLNPIAAPRSPESGLSIGKPQKIQGELGKSLVITEVLQLLPIKIHWQFAIEAGSWFTLGYQESRFPLLSQDFLLGVPIYVKYRALSAALKYNHISSHLGDGKKELRPIGYSRDFLSLSLLYQFLTYDPTELNIYLNSGYLHKVIPKNLPRWFLSSDIEIMHRVSKENALFLAQELAYNQDTSITSYSAELGILLFRRSSAKPRIAFTIYYGDDRRGQFYKDRMTEIGIGFFIR